MRRCSCRCNSDFTCRIEEKITANRYFYVCLILFVAMVATHSSTKFFTNQEENTLLNKIEDIFHHRQIHFFDALVGYFYASGYFRVRPYIERAAEVRVLVGINVDKLVHEASQQGVLFTADAYKSQEDFFQVAKKNIQQAKYSKVVEDGMLGMIEDIASGKLQIRVHPKQNIHAKVYIFREQTYHPHGYGAVITGSSTGYLSESGCENRHRSHALRRTTPARKQDRRRHSG